MSPVCVINDVWNMVCNHEACKTDLFQRTHHFKHIAIAVVNEGFSEFWNMSLDISEMDVENFVAFSEITDRVRDTRSHFGPGTDTEIESVYRAVGDFHPAFEALKVTEQTRHPRKGFDGRDRLGGVRV